MKTISFVHYKGGVGKTTATALLCRILSAAGYRVLAIDLDRFQCYLSRLLGGLSSLEICGKRSSTAFASDVLSDLLRKTTCSTLDYITQCSSLCDPNSRDPFQLCKRFGFFQLQSRYDYILIDTPPGFSNLLELALCASDDIIVSTDMSTISLSVVERFCADIERRSGLFTARCHILRYFINETTDEPKEWTPLQKLKKGRLSAHVLSADDHVRFLTSGCAEFLEQLLPAHIVLQCVNIAADLLFADRKRLEKASVDLCDADDSAAQKDQTAIMFDSLPDSSLAEIRENSYSIAAN